MAEVILFPTICFWVFKSTIALSSNLIQEPSGLCHSFLVLTTTALVTSPLFTFKALLPEGRTCCTTTLISSPIRAKRPLLKVFTHLANRAPELSITAQTVCVCIIWRREKIWDTFHS
eukprot:NODE_176_length_15869_cov_0.275777.p10 type:complete len:117 gc:universal NODE_176_length_15869_cov_0.275777:14745-15095(+)